MQTNLDIDIQIIDKYAEDIAKDVAKNLYDVAQLLEQISPDQYGSLIASLRWNASRSTSEEFLADYRKYTISNSYYS